MTVIWNSKDGLSWSREVFKDVAGHPDEVRVQLDWYVGKGPDDPDKTRDSTLTSEPEWGALTMTDRHTFAGGVAASQPPDVDRGAKPVYLKDQLHYYSQDGSTTIRR